MLNGCLTAHNQWVIDHVKFRVHFCWNQGFEWYTFGFISHQVILISPGAKHVYTSHYARVVNYYTCHCLSFIAGVFGYFQTLKIWVATKVGVTVCFSCAYFCWMSGFKVLFSIWMSCTPYPLHSFLPFLSLNSNNPSTCLYSLLPFLTELQ